MANKTKTSIGPSEAVPLNVDIPQMSGGEQGGVHQVAYQCHMAKAFSRSLHDREGLGLRL